MYEVSYLKPAERYLKKIKDKQLLMTMKNAINELKKNPFSGSQKTGDLRGFYGYDVQNKRVNYEIAYRIYEENKLIVIVLAGTRENFYKELKRLIK